MRALSKPARQLLALVTLGVCMYFSSRVLRFSSDWLNLAFYAVCLTIPFAALRIAVRLSARTKAIAISLLTPTVLVASLALLFVAACDVPAAVAHREFSRPIAYMQLGSSIIALDDRETAGGALGPHWESLEQRRTLVPGIYLYRTLDDFDDLDAGTITATSSKQIAIHIPAGKLHAAIDETYTIKPWVYF